MSDSTSRIIDSVPPFKDNGFAGVMGAQDEGFTLQSLLIAQAGASPFTVDLEANGLKRMEGASYVVLVHNEAGTGTIDESTKDPGSFDVIGAADTNVLNILICGRLEGQKA
jgi:hypothetical protein